ncbi:MAG: methylenetetrahydrofolate reductase C-terminal domain-containing protein [Endomicrobiaceae bacterium]|nr:methylenetetrahydrofolate reductase C-terminal domain-containing protein [Endomicrobiaceae bacterium]
MIITSRKEIGEILSQINEKDKVFVVGCGGCATKCDTGSQKAVDDMTDELEKNNITVEGSIVLDNACDVRLAKRDITKSIKDKNVTAILTLTCGAGVQAIEKVTDLKIISGLDSLFVGTTERIGVYKNFCSNCGECILGRTAGICPKTRCQKGLLNGPCGGFVNGKCEVDQTLDCAWVLIYEKLKKNNKLGEFKNSFLPPRKYNKKI